MNEIKLNHSCELIFMKAFYIIQDNNIHNIIEVGNKNKVYKGVAIFWI